MEKWSSYNCPSCKIPLLVGEHSIKIDRDRISKERMEAIEKAAHLVVDSRPFGKCGEFVPVKSQYLDELRRALDS